MSWVYEGNNPQIMQFLFLGAGHSPNGDRAQLWDMFHFILHYQGSATEHMQANDTR